MYAQSMFGAKLLLKIFKKKCSENFQFLQLKKNLYNIITIACRLNSNVGKKVRPRLKSSLMHFSNIY